MTTPIFDNVGTDTKPTTLDEHGKPTLKPTAKVTAGALTGLGLTVLVAALGAITPDLLTFLGPWSNVGFVAIGALAASLGAYIRRPADEIA